MGTEVILKDDGYDELEGVFNKDSEIPGDELTGIIGDPGDDGSGKSDDADADAGDKSTGDKDADDKDASAVDDKDDDDKDDDTDKDDDKDKDADADIGDTDDDKDKNADADADVDSDDTDDADKDTNETDLRAQLREQQRRVALTEAKLDTFARQQKADKDAADSDDDVDAKPVTPSVIEANQAKLNELADTRGEIIADMLELMKVNPKYEDVEDVCSKTNLDDTIETLARAQVAKEGGDLVETMMGLEVDIWSQRNPYSYMYGLIKEIHPRYKETEDKDVGDDKGDTDDSGSKKKKTPKKAPLSALDLSRGGGDKNLGKWTAEKIDNLPESELNTVPDAVYTQYLSGDLDK